MDIKDFIFGMPKAELHVHLEGALEPELLLSIAQRNNVVLPYKSIDELKKAYAFKNLQNFLDLFYQATLVLQTERDFYDLTMAYLTKARSQGVLYAEIFFETQTYAQRGIAASVLIAGITQAFDDAYKTLGISAKLILCFLREREEREAIAALEQILPYKENIVAVGLASAERDNPPEKFKHVFALVRKHGFFVTIHAGEEGPAEYVCQALDVLHADRIDHGIHALDDTTLVGELASRQVPLTLCPFSNFRLGVVKNMQNYPLKKMMDAGLLVSINSDDPAYFGGYIADNYLAMMQALKLSRENIIQLAKNSFVSSFLPAEEKQKMLEKVAQYTRENT